MDNVVPQIPEYLSLLTILDVSQPTIGSSGKASPVIGKSRVQTLVMEEKSCQ